MRISDSPFLVGLSLAERRRIVQQAVAEQALDVNQLVETLYRESARAAEEAIRPIAYWSSIARANAHNPTPTPLEFWAGLEQQRRTRSEIERQAAVGALFGADASRGAQAERSAMFIRPAVGLGLSPLEFARGWRVSQGGSTPHAIAEVSPPARNPRAAVVIRGEVVSPVGRIVDVFA